MNGVLVADKPAGWTSHDAVAKVKKTLGADKVGHLGTLDPMATGVLPLVINGATRFASRLEAGSKEYLAALKLGEETDTYDKDGKVVSRAQLPHIAEGALEEALLSFKGVIKQVPPMYSAVKQSGVPLYKLARKGVVVERAPKEVEVYSLEILEVLLPYVRFRVSCSKGTYIRSICHDAGRLLGVGAHLTELRRTESSGFKIDSAVSPTVSREELFGAIIPLEDALRRAAAGFEPAKGQRACLP